MKLKRTLGGTFVAAALLLTLAAPAQASYSDLPASHWAYEQMDRANALGIIKGVGDGRMEPQGTLTWAQFLTMMGRAFAPERYRSASQILPWDLAGYQTALEAGMLLPDEFLPVSPETLGEPVSRQDTVVLLSRVIPEGATAPNNYWYDWGFWGDEEEAAPKQEVWEALSDYFNMDRSHQRAVDRLYELEVLKGKSDGTFGPYDTLQRADGTVLLMRTLECVDRERYGDEMLLTVHFADRSGTEIAPVQMVEGRVGYSLYWLVDDRMPQNYKVADYYNNDTISSACSEYTLVVAPMTQAEIEQRIASDKLSRGEMTYEEYSMQDFWLRLPGVNDRKLMQLFGNTEQYRFGSREEAEAGMATVTVPVWRMGRNGKTAGTASFQVHAALADEVTAIFTEIYNDPEQFPIADLGGYSWRGDSATGEHNCGTAIDINSDQNYQVRDGQAMAGSLWKPGENPYSIPVDGSVVRIFTEHGWSWGGDAWSWDTNPNEGYHDYMHFSYMGG